MTAHACRRAALATGLWLAAAFAGTASDFEEQERLAAEAKQEQMKQLMQQRDRPLQIQGTVVDPSGAPVADAEITVHILQYSPNPETLFGTTKTVVARSQADGSFSVTGEHGREAYIHRIARSGYQDLSVADLPQIFRPAPEGAAAPPATAPAVITLPRAQKGQPLLKGSGRLDLGPDGTPAAVPLLALTEEDMDTLGRDAADAWPGLRATATRAGDPPAWTVSLRGRGEADLLQLAGAPAAEAPAEGYTPQVDVSVPAGPPYRPIDAVLFLKSSAPEVYSLLRIKLRPAPDRCTVHFESLTNPYGTRGLQDAPEEMSRAPERRFKEREARSALARGRKAPPPGE